jgi:conserved oligomeric Golgi complex subunit 6
LKLEKAKEAAITQNELSVSLRARIQSLENEVSVEKRNLETLRASHDSATAASTAAVAMEHEALVKTKADLVAIAAETEALKSAQAHALEEAALKLKEFQSKVAEAEALHTELAGLKTEKEQNASKISELEIEILELKESQETAEDERGDLLARLKSAEDELSKAVSATQQAFEKANANEEEHVRRSADMERAHAEALKGAADEQAKVVAEVEILRMELTTAKAAHEQTKAEAHAAAEEHARNLAEVETNHLGKQSAMSSEILRIKTELEVSYYELLRQNEI